jgi:hypothetical protein
MKPDGKGHLGKPSSKWEGNVTVDLERTERCKRGSSGRGQEFWNRFTKCQILENSASGISNLRSFTGEIKYLSNR